MSINVRLSEVDESGGLGAEYRFKADPKNKFISELEVLGGNRTRFHSPRTFGLHTLAEIFLPTGFPDSVTPGRQNSPSHYSTRFQENARYQIFDSLQAFSSSIAGLLSSRAVLEGFGVGDENASSTNAVLLSVVQDAAGRLATIFFAWRFGPALAPEAKLYRLAADIFNDSAFVLDCLSPALPTQLRIAALCMAGAMRAVCGVCGSGAKAALSVHFAKAGNVGELNAKDASQETIIGLLGMLCGSFLMSHITSRPATWLVLSILLVIHLGTNFLAVRAVTLITLNRQRTNIAYGLYCAQPSSVPAPPEVARHERIFERPGVIRDPLLSSTESDSLLGRCILCSSAKDLLHRLRKLPPSHWAIADEVFRDEAYILIGTKPDTSTPCTVLMCLKRGAKPEDYLKAWVNAYELCHITRVNKHQERKEGSGRIRSAVKLQELHDIRFSLDCVNKSFPDFLEKAKQVGWDLTANAICTTPVRTLDIEINNEVKKNS